jgi:hypothetical protein
MLGAQARVSLQRRARSMFKQACRSAMDVHSTAASRPVTLAASRARLDGGLGGVEASWVSMRCTCRQHTRRAMSDHWLPLHLGSTNSKESNHNRSQRLARHRSICGDIVMAVQWLSGAQFLFKAT